MSSLATWNASEDQLTDATGNGRRETTDRRFTSARFGLNHGAFANLYNPNDPERDADVAAEIVKVRERMGVSDA